MVFQIRDGCKEILYKEYLIQYINNFVIKILTISFVSLNSIYEAVSRTFFSHFDEENLF